MKSVGKTAGGKMTISHAVKATSAAVSVSGSQGAPKAVATDGEAVVSSPTVDRSDVPAFNFTDIRLDGGYVVMKAENVVPGVNYTTVADGKEAGVTTATGNTIILVRPKEGDSAIIRGVAK